MKDFYNAWSTYDTRDVMMAALADASFLWQEQLMNPSYWGGCSLNCKDNLPPEIHSRCRYSNASIILITLSNLLHAGVCGVDNNEVNWNKCYTPVKCLYFCIFMHLLWFIFSLRPSGVWPLTPMLETKTARHWDPWLKIILWILQKHTGFVPCVWPLPKSGIKY